MRILRKICSLKLYILSQDQLLFKKTLGCVEINNQRKLIPFSVLTIIE